MPDQLIGRISQVFVLEHVARQCVQRCGKSRSRRWVCDGIVERGDVGTNGEQHAPSWFESAQRLTLDM